VYTPKLPFESEYDDTIRDVVGALFADNPRWNIFVANGFN